MEIIERTTDVFSRLYIVIKTYYNILRINSNDVFIKPYRTLHIFSTCIILINQIDIVFHTSAFMTKRFIYRYIAYHLYPILILKYYNIYIDTNI